MKTKIPLTWLLGLVALMYFLVERDIRIKLFPERSAPLGIELELDKRWDKLIFKRAKEATDKKKSAVKKEKKIVLPEPTATITAFYTDTEPVLDGKLDDACWKTAQSAYPFIEYKFKCLAHNQTHAYAAYSAKNLYIGFMCEEESIENIKCKETSHDGRVFSDDCIEIFIDTGGKEKSYFHLALNTGGTKYENQCVISNGTTTYDKSWNPFWHAKTFIGDSFWSAEICIPLRELRVGRIRDGRSWRINFNRERYAGEKEYSSWSCTYGRFHTPKRFGTIIFRKEGLSLKLLPIRSRVGKNNLTAKLRIPPNENLSCEVKLFSEKDKLISTQEATTSEDDTNFY